MFHHHLTCTFKHLEHFELDTTAVTAWTHFSHGGPACLITSPTNTIILFTLGKYIKITTWRLKRNLGTENGTHCREIDITKLELYLDWFDFKSLLKPQAKSNLHSGRRTWKMLPSLHRCWAISTWPLSCPYTELSICQQKFNIFQGVWNRKISVPPWGERELGFEWSRVLEHKINTI